MSQQDHPVTQMKWMIYGAYGYTGELIAREAVKRGLRPVLGGAQPRQDRTLGPGAGA
ncbi:short subunit dehydrogenase-like uncharacterized protein [Pseudomonas chlororaphis]